MPHQRGAHNLCRWGQTLMLGILALGLLAGCAAPAVPTSAPPRLAADPAGPGADAALEVKGRLEPRRYVELGLSSPGRVESVAVREGDRVEAGALLFRLDGYEGLAAEVSAAEFELVQAQQALDDLYRTAGVALGEATGELKRAEKNLALAQDRLDSLQKPAEQQRIDQVYANLLLAEKRLADLKEDLSQARQKFANKHSIIWLFTDRHDFRLGLTLLEKNIAYAERRYWDAKEKYEDLLAPVDEIDLAVAQAELAAARARLHQAERERLKLLDGPDRADVEAAQARIRAAEARLAAAKTALRMAEITSPAAGVVVELESKPGEWARPGQVLAVVADLSEWVVETGDLREADVPGVRAGQQVRLSLDAYPELALNGVVESVSLYSEDDEEDVYYRAKIGLDQTASPFRWGMTARIQFIP